MQAVFVEALMGLFGSAILGLAGFQTILGRRFNNNLRWNLYALSVARRDSRILAMAMSEMPLPMAAGASAEAVEITLTQRSLSTGAGAVLDAVEKTMSERPLPKSAMSAGETAFQACPSCGLQGPEPMIKEHFLGSPTHEAGKLEADTRDEEAPLLPTRKRDPASLAMLRSILRQLAPPRAFGLRSQEREIDPLRGLARRARILPSSLVSTALLP